MSDKKNLVISTYTFLKKYGGGIESWLQKILNHREELLKKYNHIYVIGASSNNETMCDVYSNDTRLSFVFFKTGNRIQSIFNYISIVKNIYHRDKNIDIIYIGVLYPSLPILFLPKKIKSYIWLRSYFKYEINSLSLRKIKNIAFNLEKKCLKRATHIIANGTDTKLLYQKQYPSLKNIIVIPNAVEAEKFDPTVISLSTEIVKIAFVGRFYEVKGIKPFIESIKHYNNTDNKCQFYFVGWGEYESEINNLVNCYDNVHNLGKMDNDQVADFLKTIDVTVNLCYSNEQMGGAGVSNSLLESIFSNNLIVAWDNFCYSQILDDKNSVLVAENDVSGLVNAYIDISLNREVYKEKISTMSMMKENYTFEKHMNSLVNLLKENDIKD